jgi:hypothetical protein
VVAAALGGVLGADAVAHEDVDLHEALVLPVLLEQLHVLPQEVYVLPVLKRLPVPLLRLPTAVVLQPAIVLLLGGERLAGLDGELLP